MNNIRHILGVRLITIVAMCVFLFATTATTYPFNFFKKVECPCKTLRDFAMSQSFANAIGADFSCAQNVCLDSSPTERELFCATTSGSFNIFVRGPDDTNNDKFHCVTQMFTASLVANSNIGFFHFDITQAEYNACRVQLNLIAFFQGVQCPSS